MLSSISIERKEDNERFDSRKTFLSIDSVDPVISWICKNFANSLGRRNFESVSRRNTAIVPICRSAEDVP